MPEPEKIDIRRLASLLDDPDENVAVSAIAELLNREDELGDLPAELQESSNPLMRRRVHQLETALTMIRRRRFLNTFFQDPRTDFTEGLIQIHLQWYDRDSESSLRRKLRSFRKELSAFPLGNLREAGEAFAALGITPTPATTLKPELFCIGPMLDDRCGVASLWCGLICALLKNDALPADCDGRFVVVQGKSMLVPENNWLCSPAPESGRLQMWTGPQLLYQAALNLFSAAVNSDSFRYVLTIAEAITGDVNGETLSMLPYPYNPGEEELS